MPPRYRRTPLGVVALALLAALTACNSTQVKTAAMSPVVTRVADRHDAYVKADTTMASSAYLDALGQTAFLRQEMQKETVPATEISGPLNAVCDRYDGYVGRDPALTTFKRQVELRSSALLRAALKAGGAMATDEPSQAKPAAPAGAGGQFYVPSPTTMP